MTAFKLVVDGSNVATEGRTLPSLSQLDEAVRALIEEYPAADVIVIVDSTFAHRIATSERALFEEAYNAGEIITPPAGTIGRGDSFILKVADKIGATVFSNDSFQEFHGTYDWLFAKGRLIGGKPIPGFGWVFADRTPVKGPKSREAVREARRTQVRVGSPEAMRPMPVPKAPPPFIARADDDLDDYDLKRIQKDARRAEKLAKHEAKLAKVVAEEARAERKKRKRRSGSGEVAGHVNDAGPFLRFISEHPIGGVVEAEVESYSSHGFYVVVGDARCYIPLVGVADPAPRSAKEIVRRDEVREFIVRAFDAPRRGIELALPGSPAAADLVLGDAFDESDATDDEYGESTATDESAADVTAGVTLGAAVGVAPAQTRGRRTRTAPATTEAAPAPARAPRGRRGAPAVSSDDAEAEVLDDVVTGEPPTPSRRSRRPVTDVEVVATPKPARRGRTTAVAHPLAEPVLAEPVVAEPVVVLPAVAEPARRGRKVASAPVEAVPVVSEPVRRGRKAAAPDASEPAVVEATTQAAGPRRRGRGSASVAVAAVEAQAIGGEVLAPATARTRKAPGADGSVPAAAVEATEPTDVSAKPRRGRPASGSASSAVSPAAPSRRPRKAAPAPTPAPAPAPAVPEAAATAPRRARTASAAVAGEAARRAGTRSAAAAAPKQPAAPKPPAAPKQPAAKPTAAKPTTKRAAKQAR